jgi:predicted regulator of Ras-like GTPase activity (Roadblock/LC7/MglB family)
MKNLVLTDDLTDKLEAILEQLQAKLPGTALLLTDVGGRLLSSRGVQRRYDPVSLAALVAGNMAATTEIARQIGEHQPFQLIFHEGDENNIYLSEIGGSFLLVVVFDQSLQLGIVRLFTRQAVKELRPLVETFERLQEEQKPSLDSDFGTELTTEMDQAFRDWAS